MGVGVCKCIVVLYVMRNTGVDPGWGGGLNEGAVQGDDKVFLFVLWKLHTDLTPKIM